MSSVAVYGVALLFYTTLKAAEDHRLRYHLALLLEHKNQLRCVGVTTHNGSSTHRDAC